MVSQATISPQGGGGRGKNWIGGPNSDPSNTDKTQPVLSPVLKIFGTVLGGLLSAVVIPEHVNRYRPIVWRDASGRMRRGPWHGTPIERARVAFHEQLCGMGFYD